MISRKAQSQIVTAVLLILIVIALAVLILNFSTTFVKEKLSGTGCFDAVGQVEFTNSNKYTCFDSKGDTIGANDELLLQVHLGDINESVVGFLLETGGANTRSVEIRAGDTGTDNIYMFGKVDTDPLEIPGRNEERTYVILVGDAGVPESVKIYPILNDEQVCEASDAIQRVSLCKI